jgi:hypothetical protein
MPDYVCVAGLILAAIFVASHLVATHTAYEICKKTCRVLDKQFEQMEKDLANGY